MRVQHGGDVWSVSRLLGRSVYDVIDFSSNVNDFSPLVHQCEDCERSMFLYPDPDLDGYMDGISSYNIMEKENFVLVPGLTYAIYRFLSFVGRDKVVVGTPTFTEYRKAGVVGNKATYLPSANIVDDPSLVTRAGANVVFLVSPSNPTGDVIQDNELRGMLEYFLSHDIILFLDQAFVEFASRTMAVRDASLVNDFPNLFIGRSLSKLSGLPSLRLGYIITNGKNVRSLKDKIEPWAVDQHSLHLLSKINFASYENLPSLVAEVRERFIRDMGSLMFRVVGEPKANFVSFRLPDRIEPDKLFDTLAVRGLLLRSLWNYPEFGDKYIRIAIKREEKMGILLHEVRDILETG